MNDLLRQLRRPMVLIGMFTVLALGIVLAGAFSGAGAEDAGGSPDVAGQSTPVDGVTTAAGGAKSKGKGQPRLKGSAQEMLDQGSRAFQLGRYDEAVSFYQAAIQRQPDSAMAYNLLATAHRGRFNALRSRADRDQEIVALREAVRLDPGFVAALQSLGTALYTDGRAEEGAQYLRRVLLLDPAHPEREQLSRLLFLLPPAAGATPTAEPATSSLGSEPPAAEPPAGDPVPTDTPEGTDAG